MKTLKISVTSALFFITALSLAQSNNIQRTIAKEVQKINNETWLNTEHLLTVSSVAYVPISKDVQLISNQSIRKQTSGNMASTGYPLWTISKDVQRVSTLAKSSRVCRTRNEQPQNASIINNDNDLSQVACLLDNEAMRI